MIGISGAHRTGKSTLARAYAEREGIPFVQTTVSGVFERMGINPSVDLPLTKRIEVQQHILDALDKQYSSAGAFAFVTDRTPIDFMAYTMAEIGQSKMTRRNEKLLDAYFKDCVDAANQHFSVIAVLRPAIKVVNDVGKGALGKHYINHIATLISGFATRSDIQARVFAVPYAARTIIERVDALGCIVDKAVADHKSQLRSMEEFTGEQIVCH